MKVLDIFNDHVQEYENWFRDHEYAYKSELLAIREHMEQLPAESRGIEIGLGTGQFAGPLGIKEGVEPAESMGARAIARGLEVMNAEAESLPYKDMHFDFALMVTLICYLWNPLMALRESYRILKPGGRLILGFIDKNSLIGKDYSEHRDKSVFYKQANFHDVEKVLALLKQARFKNPFITQTLFHHLEDIKEIEPAREGYGEGSFVVVSASK